MNLAIRFGRLAFSLAASFYLVSPSPSEEEAAPTSEAPLPREDAYPVGFTATPAPVTGRA